MGQLAFGADGIELLPAVLGATDELKIVTGGGLLHPLLSGFARNFRAGAPEDERLLDVLCSAEAHATSLGALSPLFTVFVGRRPA